MGDSGESLISFPDPIVLREVRWQDLEMLRVHRNQWNTRRWLENCSIISVEQQKEWFDRGAYKVRVATIGSDIVGLARIEVVGDLATVGCDVFESYRHRGLGSLIFDAALKRSADLGAKRADLWVFVANDHAVRIYQKAGFVWDLSSPIKTFLRPEQEDGDPAPMRYARMIRSL